MEFTTPVTQTARPILGGSREAMGLKCVLFDWGDTLMVDFPDQVGPMVFWSAVKAVPHAVETLKRLRASGLYIALATNAADSDEADIRAALARVGLDDLIDRVYCVRGVGHAKPSAAFFGFIKHDLGLPAADLIMVGDNYVVDVRGANNAGIRAVWLHDDGGADLDMRTQRSIRSLDELPGVLRTWAGTA